MTAGTLGAFSSLAYDLRGAGVENQAQKIIDRWRADPMFTVEYMTGWDALARFPETPEAIGQYDVIFISDVESDSLILYPAERSMRAPMGPNRLKLVREFVRQGGALAMIGGYATFTGRHNTGNYGGTPIEEALPVNCSERNDDRVETPEGALAQVLDSGHPIMQGLDWSSEPIFNGYNRVTLKPKARLLARIGEAQDPLLVVGEFGKGRSLAFTSDIAPHWGAGFQDWPGSAPFMSQMVLWLAGRSGA